MSQCHPSRFKPAEYAYQRYRHVPESHVPFDALLEPGYWAHVGQKLNPTDEIRIDAEDGSYTALLYVQDAGRLYAKVAVIYVVRLEHVEVGADVPIPSNYRVLWQGPELKWCVVRDTDRIFEGAGEKGAAMGWLRDHVRTTTQAPPITPPTTVLQAAAPPVPVSPPSRTEKPTERKPEPTAKTG
jgi:hypothetical protein